MSHKKRRINPFLLPKKIQTRFTCSNDSTSVSFENKTNDNIERTFRLKVDKREKKGEKLKRTNSDSKFFQNQQDEENKFHLHIIVIDMFTQCVFDGKREQSDVIGFKFDVNSGGNCEF